MGKTVRKSFNGNTLQQIINVFALSRIFGKRMHVLAISASVLKSLHLLFLLLYERLILALPSSFETLYLLFILLFEKLVCVVSSSF